MGFQPPAHPVGCAVCSFFPVPAPEGQLARLSAEKEKLSEEGVPSNGRCPQLPHPQHGLWVSLQVELTPLVRVCWPRSPN